MTLLNDLQPYPKSSDTKQNQRIYDIRLKETPNQPFLMQTISFFRHYICNWMLCQSADKLRALYQISAVKHTK